MHFLDKALSGYVNSGTGKWRKIMDFKEVFNDVKVNGIPDKTVVGIDIGSRQSKAVLLHNGQLYTALIPTGFFMKQTAGELLENLFEQSGLALQDVEYIVGTGYGRVALEFENIPNRIVTEISCHGLGGHYLGDNIQTIIDIGGQDSKVIKIDPENGKVVDFAMNDKCAAGTGRFLEKIADVLGEDATKIGEIALKSENPANISSQCVVFAESEVISGRAKGTSVSDLAAGINLSVVRRVNTLLNRVGIVPNVLFTGGVSNNVGVKKAFEDTLGFPVERTKLDTVYAGALGAALFAAQFAEEKKSLEASENEEFKVDITSLQDAIAIRKESYIKKTTGKKKNVAYLCAYTPIEILSAANVAHLRVLHAGNQEEVMAGEALTQSVFCDFAKSVIGGFEEENPLFRAIEKVYTFYTCDCMRKTAEAVDETYVPATIFNLPRRRHDKASRDYFMAELEGFKENLEKLTGEKVDENEIKKYIGLYNRAKQYIRTISGYRKLEYPPLTSGEFRQVALSYYYLPAEELLPQLAKIEMQLRGYKPVKQKRRARIMISGGVLADGDNKITKIVEEELGARIVVEDNCSGLKPFARDLNSSAANVYEDLADGYLGQAPCARMKPIEEMVDFSESLADEYKPDGIIFYYMKFCPCYSIVLRAFLDKFQEKNIPVLVIPGDYAKGDEGQIRTRIEAFIEVLGGTREQSDTL